MRKTKKILLVLAACVTFAFAALVVIFLDELFTQAALLPETEELIGAKVVAPYVKAGGAGVEVITFGDVRPGSRAARAGIAPGDVLVSDRTMGSFCKRVLSSRGRSVEIQVVHGGDGVEIEKRSRRHLRLDL